MILDQNALFSDAQAITADAASTNHYDLGEMGVTAYNSVQLRRNIGKGCYPIPLLIQVVEDFDALTSLEIIVQTDEDPAFGSAKNVMSVTVPLAELIAGFISPIDKLPRGIVERYLRIYYNVNGSNPTVGKVTAGIVGAVDGGYQG
jgi:hypothetical protein